jgi:hypothetical protein
MSKSKTTTDILFGNGAITKDEFVYRFYTRVWRGDDRKAPKRAAVTPSRDNPKPHN